MATLTRRFRWKRWAPDIGENRELEGGPVLFLELATDLTAEQLSAALERASQLGEGIASREELQQRVQAAMTEALGPYVRVHGGPHTVDGRPLATFADYVALVQDSASMGSDQLRELLAALTAFNSVRGPDELFSLRHSGGARTTDAQSAERAGAPPAAP